MKPEPMRLEDLLAKVDINRLIMIAYDAGEAAMEIYNTEFEAEIKGDNSPLTQADRASNDMILQGLRELYPFIPCLSEESKMVAFSERKHWPYMFLIDPLDGTKEFIKKNGEFTVNIALIHEGEPVAGVVYAPALDRMFAAMRGRGARMVNKRGTTPIELVAKTPNMEIPPRVVASRSHMSPEVEEFIEKFPDAQMVSMGSSLKFMLVAAGEADIYPRLAPTMEWDTAAAQAIVEESGGYVFTHPNYEKMKYNKENLLNPYFIAMNSVGWIQMG